LCQLTGILDILILKTIPKILNSVVGLLLAFVIVGEFSGENTTYYQLHVHFVGIYYETKF